MTFARALLALSIPIATVAGTAESVHAQEVEPSVVAVVDPGDGDRLSEGGSDTDFVLDLPSDAACPGDSAHQDFRVQTYMVPAGPPRVELAFDGLGPTPYSVDTHESFRQPLYDPAGEPYDVGFTAEAEHPEDPGLILGTPVFDFTAYPPGTLPEGRYNIGVACTRHNEIHVLWEAELEVQHDPEDQPGGLRWTAISQVEAADTDSSSGAVVAGLGLVAALAATAVATVRRRSTRPATIPGSST